MEYQSILRLRESCSSLDKSLTLLLAELVKGQEDRGEEEEVGGDDQGGGGGDSGDSEEKDEDKGEQGEKKLKGDKSGTTAESSKSQ